MTQEEKAKAYDEAVEKLRNAFYGNNNRMCDEYRQAVISIIEPIFPELKESEEENMRKSIIGFLKTIASLKDGKTVSNEDFDSVALLEWAAWLEKQGEQKPTWSKENSCYYDDICEILINLINSPISNVNKDVVQKDLDWLNSLKERMKGGNA